MAQKHADPLVESLRVLCAREGGAEVVARKAGVSAVNLTQILTGVKLPSGNARGVGPRLRGSITDAYPDWLAVSLPERAPTAARDVITVPLLDVVASMGYGSDIHSEDAVTGALTLSPSWVHERVRPSQASALRFIHGYGDSMSPTFSSGDVLLVDTGVRDAQIDGVYVLKAHNRLFVKRVRQRMDGVFEVSSDNPAHKTADTLNGDSQVEVLGRVLWAWNGRTI